MTRRRISLAKFVAVTLVTVTTLLLVALGAAAYRSEAKRQRKELDDLIKVQANGLAVALAVPVWNIDRPVIAQVLEAMAQPKSIYGISVTAAGETYGRARDADWKLVPWDGRNVPAGMIVQEREIVFGENTIGTVCLYVTTAGIDRDLRDLADRGLSCRGCGRRQWHPRSVRLPTTWAAAGPQPRHPMSPRW